MQVFTRFDSRHCFFVVLFLLVFLPRKISPQCKKECAHDHTNRMCVYNFDFRKFYDCVWIYDDFWKLSKLCDAKDRSKTMSENEWTRFLSLVHWNSKGVSGVFRTYSEMSEVARNITMNGRCRRWTNFSKDCFGLCAQSHNEFDSVWRIRSFIGF